MSKQNNLKDFLKDVADTIREKKGTDDLINPQDFSNEIANMSGSEEALFDFFEVDLNNSLLLYSQDYNNFIRGFSDERPWAVKVQGGEWSTVWAMAHTMPYLGHGEDASAVMFKCAKGAVNTLDFFGALKTITASEFYSGEINVLQ